MSYFLAIIAMVSAATIEWMRWYYTKGKIKNLNKTWSKVISFVLWLSVVFICKIFTWHVILFGIYTAAIRGVVYDPLLNVFMGRYIDYESYTTNSWADAKERNFGISFWWQRLIYASIAGVAIILLELLS